MAKRIFSTPSQFSTCVYTGSEYKKTIPGLTMTPAQIKQMAEKGISVTTQMNAQASINPDTGLIVEPMFQRSIDANDLWQSEQTAKSNILKAHKKDKQKYG